MAPQSGKGTKEMAKGATLQCIEAVTLGEFIFASDHRNQIV